MPAVSLKKKRCAPPSACGKPARQRFLATRPRRKLICMPPCLGVRAPLAGACVSKKRTATRSLSFWVRPMASFSSLNWPSYLVCVCVAFLPLSVLLSTSFNATASHLSLPLDELFLYQNISTDAEENLTVFIEKVYNEKRLHSSLGYLP